MKKITSFKILKVMGCLIGIIFILNACSSSRTGNKLTTIKKWVNWQVEFDKNMSDTAKVHALNKIEKYITDALYNDNVDLLYYNIQFTVTPDLGKDRAHISVTIIFDKAGMQGSVAPRPHGGGPGKVLIPNFTGTHIYIGN
ncbi:MAG: hypothetical protein ABI472_02215 [Ginsengibacter sp.]